MIGISWEIQCLPYAEFFVDKSPISILEQNFYKTDECWALAQGLLGFTKTEQIIAQKGTKKKGEYSYNRLMLLHISLCLLWTAYFVWYQIFSCLSACAFLFLAGSITRASVQDGRPPCHHLWRTEETQDASQGWDAVSLLLLWQGLFYAR